MAEPPFLLPLYHRAGKSKPIFHGKVSGRDGSIPSLSLSKKWQVCTSPSLPCVKGGGPPKGGSEGLTQRNVLIFSFLSLKSQFLLYNPSVTACAATAPFAQGGLLALLLQCKTGFFDSLRDGIESSRPCVFTCGRIPERRERWWRAWRSDTAPEPPGPGSRPRWAAPPRCPPSLP